MLEPLVTAGILPSVPKSPDGQSYAYGVSPDKKESLFVANLKTKSSKNNSGGGSDNSCSFAQMDISLPTNCLYSESGGGPLCLYSPLDPCAQYVLDNPDKICVAGPTANFCNIYNQLPTNFPNYCGCSLQESFWGQCGPNGGSTWVSTSIGCTVGTICDAPPPSICDGSSQNEYCSCI